MANVRYVCLSDLHLGEEDGLLTNISAEPLAGRLGASGAEALLDCERQHGQSRVAGEGKVDLTTPSPSLLLLAECLTDILKHNTPGSAKPTLVLNGDVLELALAEMDKETEGAEVPDAVSFIFGHTHKPFEDAMDCEGYGQAVKIFNTGGWVVDTVKPDPPHGAAAVLLDEELNAVSLRFFNEGHYEARVEEPLGPGQAHGALYAHLAGIVKPDREPWRSLGTTISREVRRRAKFLESRIRRLQANPEASSKM